MNIKITHKWLLEFLDTKATPDEMQKMLSLCGPSIEHVEKIGEDDYSYDIEITSNRVDTASVVGIAREAATILTRFGIKSTFKPPILKSYGSVSSPLPLDIVDDENTCKRILAVVMDNVTIAPSKKYIQDRLEASGIRSLNNVVDITNYVMTEIGHPTHVFDYDRIKTHKFIIRHAKNGEEITTLDGKKYSLCNKDVIIDDGTGTVIDLPGIMGTKNSVVTQDTKRIIFFIESNDPVAIRGSSMRYGIRTVAATINEKNPDPETAKQALLRGVELFQTLTGAKQAGNIIDIYKEKQKKQVVKTTFDYLDKRIGVNIPHEQILDILKNLEFELTVDRQNLTIEVPSFRSSDITIPDDIVEEVARIYGYHNLPNALSPSRYIKQPSAFETLFVYQNKIKMFLKHLGLNEVLNYSMISSEMIENLDLSLADHLHLSNVMSEEIKYLRTSLRPSLIKNIKTNEGKQDSLRLFEIAKIYMPTKDNLPEEKYKLAIVTNTSFFDLKGIIEALFKELNIETYSFSKSQDKTLHPGIQTNILLNKQICGVLGQLKTVYQNKFGIKSTVYLTELDFEMLIKCAKPISNYVPIHPYAVVKLDATIKIDRDNYFEKIKTKAFANTKYLNKIEVIDRYKDNITLRFYFSSPSENITEEVAKKELIAACA